MATILNRTTTFATNGTVTAAGLHNLIDDTAIYAGLITTQTELTTVGTADQLLIAVNGISDTGAPRRATVQNLFDDALTSGTYTNLSLSGALTYGTATGNRTVSTSATITTGTIPNLTSSTANITLGTIPTLTAGTTTSTAQNVTRGTIQTLTASTGTIGTFNSTTGTVSTLNSTTGTISTLNSTTGTIGIVNSTIGTIANLNSTTGTIANLSTTLAGDFTITQGTGTIGTAKVTPTNLLQPLTIGTAVNSTSGTAIDFTSIPSWAKRINIILNGVSTSGTSNILIQIGSGSIIATGYLGFVFISSVYRSAFTTGFIVTGLLASDSLLSSQISIILSGSNTWIESANITDYSPSVLGASLSSGKLALGGTLDRVRITTVGGADTFDAGSINIMYEG